MDVRLYLRYFLILVVFVSLSTLASAEVPQHNPDLDYKCSPGFQWSRGTVACEQANCPHGAGRTYTYECNCGEAWDSNSPLVTCWKNTLAIKCIPRGDKCDEYPYTFDVLTGECMEGYEYDQDLEECITTGAPILECSVKDLDGNPVDGAIIKYNVYNRTDAKNPIHSYESITREDGSYSNVIPRKGSYSITISVEYPMDIDMPRLIKKIKVRSDRVGNCSFTLYNPDQVERKIKSDLEKFLRDACFPPNLIEKIRNAKIKAGTGVTNSLYDPNDKTLYLSQGDMNAGWDELQKALAHELGHWVSDNLIDDGKNVGGSHDVWEPTVSSSWFIDAGETAYEEAMAEFFAIMYLKSQGRTYDPLFETPEQSYQVLGLHPLKGHLIEGVITSFLYQYYKDSLNLLKTPPAQVFGDFFQSTKDGVGRIFTRPPRTVEEFIAARKKGTGGSWDCQVSNTGNLDRLVTDFRLTEEGRARILLEESSESDDLENLKLSSNILAANQEVVIPKDSGLVAVQWSDRSKRRQGKIPMVYFSKDATSFQVSSDGKSIILEDGKAYAMDADIETPSLRITGLGTEYVVEVSADKETVTVLEGSVEAEDIETAETVTVEEEKKVEYTPDEGLSEPKNADTRKIESTWRSYSSRTGDDGDSGSLCCCAPLLPAVIALLLSILIGVPYTVWQTSTRRQ